MPLIASPVDSRRRPACRGIGWPGSPVTPRRPTNWLPAPVRGFHRVPPTSMSGRFSIWLPTVVLPGRALCRRSAMLQPGVTWGDDSGDDRLRHHGRYAHARAYLETVLGRADLILLRLDAEILGSEGGEPVAVRLVLARRPAIRA